MNPRTNGYSTYPDSNNGYYPGKFPEKDWTNLPERDKHPDELLVESLMESAEKDIQMIVDYLSVKGRPVFTFPLSDTEKLQRFYNPVLRQETVSRLEEQGPQAVRQYYDEMMSLSDKLFSQAVEGV